MRVALDGCLVWPAVSPPLMATTRQWLLDIAYALEHWSSVPPDNTLLTLATETPVGAMLYLVGGIPLAERADVYAAMPLLVTNDFREAAETIRRAAAALP